VPDAGIAADVLYRFTYRPMAAPAVVSGVIRITSESAAKSTACAVATPRRMVVTVFGGTGTSFELILIGVVMDYLCVFSILAHGGHNLLVATSV
jgi:hypothetical protein